MGIKGLMKLIKQKAPNSIIDKEYSSYAGKKLAIDMPLIIYKFVIAIRNRGEDLINSDGKMTSHIYGVLSKFVNMLKFGSIPVPVFDGDAPIIKKETLIERRIKKDDAQDKLDILTNNKIVEIDNKERIKLYKRTFSIKNKQYNDIKTLVKLLGFVLVESPQEADAQCAALNITGFVDGVVTEDMDSLVFGTKKMLRNFSNKDKVVEIDIDILLQDLKLTSDEFIDICIILGSDYCKPIKGISIKDVVEIYKKNNNMLDFIKYLNCVNDELVKNGKSSKYIIPDDFLDRWFKAKEYYKHVQVKHPKYFGNIVWNKPNIEGLVKFLCIDNGFDENRIEKQLKYIMKRYNEYILNNKLDIDIDEIKNKKNKQKKQFNGGYVKKKIVNFSNNKLNIHNNPFDALNILDTTHSSNNFKQSSDISKDLSTKFYKTDDFHISNKNKRVDIFANKIPIGRFSNLDYSDSFRKKKILSQ